MDGHVSIINIKLLIPDDCQVTCKYVSNPKGCFSLSRHKYKCNLNSTLISIVNTSNASTLIDGQFSCEAYGVFVGSRAQLPSTFHQGQYDHQHRGGHHQTVGERGV